MNLNALVTFVVLFVLSADYQGATAGPLPNDAPATSSPRQEEIWRSSPFGAHGAISRPFLESDSVSPEELVERISRLEKPYEHVQDVGIRWIRPGADIYWSVIQPTSEDIKNGFFRWKVMDAFFGRVPTGVNILGTVDALPWGVNVHPAFKPGTWEFAHPAAEADYLKFVHAVVERYNGDGYQDMRGLKNPIRYWQIGNESALRPVLGARELNRELDWRGFGHLVEITYKAIKQSDPSAVVALGGMAAGYPSPNDPLSQHMNRPPGIRERDEFFVPLLKQLKGKYIDVFDIHYYGAIQGQDRDGWQWKFIKDTYDYVRRNLNQNGFQDVEIWMTETAVPSEPFGERFQAINLVKRYIFSLSLGVKKIFWWNMIEGEFPLEENTPANHFGLVYDGLGQNDPGYGVKKTAYYAYKKMVQLLEGSDWNAIGKVKEEDGTHVYRFSRQRRLIWVAWNDNPSIRQIVIPDITSEQVKITQAVPNCAGESQAKKFNCTFETHEINVIDGKAIISVGNSPVFIEKR